MTENVCYNCFHEKTQDGACPVCGYSAEQDKDKYPLALPHGTVLNGKYILGRVLGQGGFGITYVAQDWKTKKRVAVKEYLPDTMATRIEGHTVSAYSGQREESFHYGKECFLSEAKTLAEFIGNENIVRIHSYFEENGTAYFVMEYVDGVSFQNYIKDHGGKIDWQDAGRILFPIMDALGAVHAKGIIHRDVTPDNIFITEEGTVKLLDFGAARYSLGDRSRSLDVVLKHGYAPKEQYTRRGRQGAYTDVYSVAACFYFAVTGHKPPDSIERMDEDDLIPPSSLGVKVSEEQEDALLKGLNIQAADRYQNMADFKAAMTAGEEPQTVAADVLTGSEESQKERGTPAQLSMGETSQGDVRPAESVGASKSDQTSGTPAAETKTQEMAAVLRNRKLLPPVAVAAAALVVIVAAVAIGVQSSHKKSVQNADFVLVNDASGALKTKGDIGASGAENGTSEAGVSDVAEELEEVVYLVTKHTERKMERYRESYESSVYEDEYTYDKDGNELTKRWYRDGEASGWYEYTYNAEGNQLTRKSYFKDGTISSHEAYTYDAAGNVLTKTGYNDDGTASWQYQMTYDAAGNLLSGKFYVFDEDRVWSEVTYDADGNLLTQIAYATDGTIREKKMYLYDGFGNELSCTAYDADEIVLYRWEYFYDEKGNELVENFYNSQFSEEERLSIRKESTYDEAGNILTFIKTTYLSDGSTAEDKTLYSYVYDEYGNVLKKTTYDKQVDEANIKETDEYEYMAITRKVIAPENQKKRWTEW